MLKKRLIVAATITTSVVFLLGSVSVSAASTLLKKEMRGSQVASLQEDLVRLGYLSVEPTGYFGNLTAEAVRKLQKDYGYDADGIVGSITSSLIDRMLGRDKSSSTVSRGETRASGLLKEGSEGSNVTELQKDLVKLGFLSASPTGYFGSLTSEAVIKLQKKYGYLADGIVGNSTRALITKLINEKSEASTAKTAVKTKAATATNYKLPWSEVSKIFTVGKTATVYDIATGLSFKIKRTYGHNHADCETLTAKDTATMKKIFGGSWNWERRAIIVTVDNVKIAASMAGMPHAGSDKYAANQYISSRSGGYGRGQNLDTVKGNNMDGHFDVHFYGSKTHATNRTDINHQSMVNKATG